MIFSINKEATIRQDYINEKVETIYFGGGTPSLLSIEDIAGIITHLKSVFVVDREAEITLEANPDDITPDKPIAWQKIGINRLSIGIQSFIEEDLRWMNRAHNALQAEESIKLAQDAGLNNITIDLIYGTPTLSNEDWKSNIEKALTLGVNHLSCYALTVEPKTALANFIREHKMEDVDPDKQAAHFELLVKMTEEAGFEHYEISNFAKPGFRSKHNSSYWQGKPYIGLGPSSHSFNGTSRQWNIANNALYINSIKANIVPFEKEELTPAQQLNEYIMTSLRTIEGISLDTITLNWGTAKTTSTLKSAESFIYEGLISITNNRLQLTNKGKFLADGIAAELFDA